MLILIDAFEAIRNFMERGGDVLTVIAFVTLAMWTLMIERFWYFRTGHKRQIQRVIATWNARSEVKSWFAHQIRQALISQVSQDLNYSIVMIKTLVAICPLLGLLGTVTGMIEVFDVMAITGSGNARAMASGVSKATIPTMAGMVAALSGLFVTVRLEHFVQTETQALNDHLTTERQGPADA